MFYVDSVYQDTHTHSDTHIYNNNYLHSSLVITQVKGTVANVEVCMLLFLANTPLKLKMTQQHISSRAAAFSSTNVFYSIDVGVILYLKLYSRA